MKNTRTIFALVGALAALMIFASVGFAQSCPMCKESMTAAGAKLSTGFYYSILSMWSLPFVIGGGVSSVVFKSWYTKRHPGEKFNAFTAVKDTIWKK